MQELQDRGPTEAPQSGLHEGLAKLVVKEGAD